MTCIPYAAYKKVNPSSQIIIDGECVSGCNVNGFNQLFYNYELYSTLDTTNVGLNSNWQLISLLDGFVLGDLIYFQRKLFVFFLIV